MTRLNWNLVSVRLDIVLVLVQDRCMVCAKRTIGSEIILHVPDGAPRRRGSSGILFRSVWIVLVLVQDMCTVCAKRTIGSEIVLDAPDGTPR